MIAAMALMLVGAALMVVAVLMPTIEQTAAFGGAGIVLALAGVVVNEASKP